MAPSVARIPQLMSPPSKAGPAEQAQLIKKIAVAENQLPVGAKVNEQAVSAAVPDHGR
jgi:hypothetical protein